MSDIGEMFRGLREHHRVNRAANKVQGTQRLVDSGHAFDSKNEGQHLILTEYGTRIEYWPGTNLWREGGARNRGVQSLIDRLDALRDGGVS